jgi:hypothetical protein
VKLRHDGDAGDVVYSLPTIRAFAQEHGPVDVYLGVSTKDHPFGGRHFTRERVEWLMPLLAAQVEYISSVSVWDGQDVDVDLNLFRHMPGVDYSKNDIAGWYRWAFPVWYDLAEPWLKVQAEYHGRVVINRTVRYNNPAINYRFLAGHGVLFVGLAEEFEAFRQQVPDAEHARCETALHLAKLLVGNRLFVGGQSLPFAVAEGLKANRLLEVCPRCPNVLVHGRGGHDAVTQLGFEFWYNTLR